VGQRDHLGISWRGEEGKTFQVELANCDCNDKRRRLRQQSDKRRPPSVGVERKERGGDQTRRRADPNNWRPAARMICMAEAAFNMQGKEEREKKMGGDRCITTSCCLQPEKIAVISGDGEEKQVATGR